MGGEVQAVGPREIELDVTACDALDKVVLYKNSRPWRSICGELAGPQAEECAFKTRVEMGWGRSPEAAVWHGEAIVRDGLIASVEPSFRGRSVLAPSRDREEDLETNALGNRAIERRPDRVAWQCTTFVNPSTLHPQTDSVIVEIEGDHHTSLDRRINELTMTYTIGELLGGGRGTHVAGYGSEAVLVHRSIPESRCRYHAEWTDDRPESDCDTYDVGIRQVNDQWAWLSPVYVLG